MRARVFVGSMLLPLAMPASGRAWSGGGHQVVCQIAYKELTPAVRAKVAAIMARETDDRFKPFATACTWPDADKHPPKGSPPTAQSKRADDHFVNVDRTLAKIGAPDCSPAPSCLFTAIESDENALKNGKGKAQLVALKFLGHWLGDLHQPLHVSYGDDLGGNHIPVSAAVGCKELHAVWDDCIPEEVRATLGAGPGPTAFGNRLQKEITPEERAAWRKGSLADWAEESYAIARDPGTQYCVVNGGSCCYDAGSCAYGGGTRTKRLAHLPHSYDDQHVDVVKDRLKRAGVRLAAILEAQLQ